MGNHKYFIKTINIGIFLASVYSKRNVKYSGHIPHLSPSCHISQKKMNSTLEIKYEIINARISTLIL